MRLREAMRRTVGFEKWNGIEFTYPGSVTTFVASHVAAVPEGQATRGLAQRGNLKQFLNPLPHGRAEQGQNSQASSDKQ